MKKIMAIVVCFLFVFGFAGLSFAQEKAAPKVIAAEEIVAKDKKGNTMVEDIVVEEEVVTDESGAPVVKEVVVDEVVVTDKSGKVIAGEVAVGVGVKAVPPVTTAATTAAAETK